MMRCGLSPLCAFLAAILPVALLVGGAVPAAADAEQKMHVVVTSIPCYGHFMPLKAVAEELLILGHDVTLVVEPQHQSWCDSDATREAGGRIFGCRIVRSSGLFGPALFSDMSSHDDVGASFSAIFDEMSRHHEEQLPTYITEVTAINATRPVSLILTDLSTLVGFGVAAKLDVPYVSMFPLSMHMPLGPATYLPSLGTAFPRDNAMSFAQRLVNFGLKLTLAVVGASMTGRLDKVRIASGVRPIHTQAELAGMKSLILSPTIWGLDIPQPLCPNIVPLGVLSPRHGHAPMEPALAAFLESRECVREGAVYVNFGTLAVLSNRTFSNVWAALQRVPYCVVWKIREAHREAAVRATAEGSSPRFFLSQRFANPVAVMQHPSVKAFVTHCGDTSVLEAIDSLLPVAGIPIFADQADVCMRVDEAGIGRYVGHKTQFTPGDLIRALAEVVGPTRGAVARVDEAESGPTNHSFLQHLRRIRRTSQLLGGPHRGAALIEDLFTRQLLRSERAAIADGGFADFPLHQCQVLTKPFVTSEGSVVRLAQLDVIGTHLALFFALVHWGPRVLWWCARKIASTLPFVGSRSAGPSAPARRRQKAKAE